MKRILLPRNLSVIFDDEDEDVVMRFNWTLLCRVRKHYAYCQVSPGSLHGKVIRYSMYMHRLIMRPPEDMVIDHINHDGLDNRRENLRVCTYQQNQWNRRSAQRSSSQYFGVYRPKNTNIWCARIHAGNKYLWLGAYKSEIEAAMAYNKAAEIHHEGFHIPEKDLIDLREQGYDV